MKASLATLSALLVLATASVASAASVFTNPITGTNPNTSDPYTTGQTVVSNLTASGIGRGVGAVGTNANDRYNANSWNTTAIDLTAYFTWTLAPAAGFTLSLDNLIHTGQASGTGPTSFAFRSSVDGFTSDVGTPTATGATLSLSAAAFQNLTTATEFRLYGWGASAVAGSFSVNDFTFNGTVAPISTAAVVPLPTSALMGTALLGGLFLNRRRA